MHLAMKDFEWAFYLEALLSHGQGGLVHNPGPRRLRQENSKFSISL